MVAREIEKSGGVAKNSVPLMMEWQMGHSGDAIAYHRELIADAVEYMVNAHCADARLPFEFGIRLHLNADGNNASIECTDHFCLGWTNGGRQRFSKRPRGESGFS